MKLVSIIIPCFNEAKTITHLLEGLAEQTYPLDQIETIIADGFSTDGTRERIAEYKAEHPIQKIILIDNLPKTIPSGLNSAIHAAHGDYILRLDAHSIPAPDYIEGCVNDLENKKGDNVGGIWIIQPGNDGWIARSIAKAASSRLGVGDAGYRLNTASGEVDTVPFGAFKRNFLLELGGYNENLLTNEDYELNTRIRQHGGKVWLDNKIRSTYFARSTFSSLARQYWRYGFWKSQMIKSFPRTLRWRQALPPTFVLAILLTALISFFQPMFVFLLLTILFIYFFILTVFGGIISIKETYPAFIIGIPWSITIMHVCWGCGFLVGLITRPKKLEKTDKLDG